MRCRRRSCRIWTAVLEADRQVDARWRPKSLARWGGAMNPQMLAWYLGAFLVALAVLVVVHEMGHYLAAR
jgi:hypothetical protein